MLAKMKVGQHSNQGTTVFKSTSHLKPDVANAPSHAANQLVFPNIKMSISTYNAVRYVIHSQILV